jgi:hypothetical protein
MIRFRIQESFGVKITLSPHVSQMTPVGDFSENSTVNSKYQNLFLVSFYAHISHRQIN